MDAPHYPPPTHRMPLPSRPRNRTSGSDRVPASSSITAGKRARSGTRSSLGSLNQAPTTSLLTRSGSSSTMISAQKANAEFDTPSSYLSKAREAAEGGIWGLWAKGGAEERDEAEEGEAEERPAKRRKGMAEALLSTAVDAALFTGAVGYAAYQLWRGKGSDTTQERSSSPPPPPYAPLDPQYVQRTRTAQAPPSSQRRVTHVHVSRPRTRARMSSAAPRRKIGHGSEVVERTLEQVDRALVDAASEWRTGPDSAPALPVLAQEPAQGPNQLSSEALAEQPLDDDSDAEDLSNDPTMADFQSRIQSLISSGQAALSAQPDLGSFPSSIEDTELSSSAMHTRAWTTPLDRRSADAVAFSRTSTPSGIPRLVNRHPFQDSSHSRNQSPAPAALGRPSMASRAVSGLVKGPEISTLEAALDETARGPTKNWWEK